MSLTETLKLLVSARLYVNEGEKIVSHQRKLIDSLGQIGCNTVQETIILEQLEEMQSQYVNHRERLERQVLRLIKPEADSDELVEDVRPGSRMPGA
jgi:hypothetical protein